MLITPYLRLTAVFVAFREGSFTIITFGLEPYFFNSHAEKAIVKEERRRRKSFFITSSKNIELGIVERYVSNVFYSERIVRVFYSQSDKILGVFYVQNSLFSRGLDGMSLFCKCMAAQAQIS